MQEQPELLGTVERRKLLQLDKRGWQFVETGHIFVGELFIIHHRSPGIGAVGLQT